MLSRLKASVGLRDDKVYPQAPRSPASLELPRGRRGKALFGVLTIVEDELAVARAIFEMNHRISGSPYYVKSASSSNEYDVVIRRAADRGNLPAARATSELIEDFRPMFILLIGIAGGNSAVDGVAKGDIVVADFVDYSEFRKIAAGKDLKRNLPYDHPSLYLRENFVDHLRTDYDWSTLRDANRPVVGVTKVIIGNIVAGEKLLGDPDNPYQKEVLKTFDKAAAIDMESFGVARTVFEARRSVQYNPQYLVIRGISDLVDVADEDNDEQRGLWKTCACTAAATFGKELVNAVISG